jgi:hypothetical protein
MLNREREPLRSRIKECTEDLYRRFRAILGIQFTLLTSAAEGDKG